MKRWSQKITMEELKNTRKKIQKEFLFYTREFVLPPGNRRELQTI
ncbi:hypothetical protein [Desulfurobacterium sp.]